VGGFTADGVLMLALRRPDVWPAADLALRLPYATKRIDGSPSSARSLRIRSPIGGCVMKRVATPLRGSGFTA
jgi:3-methyladenine DNA glycosylase/8-oxoguanine DNA glycosylase